MKVSIIITSYNYLGYLKECLKSSFKQTYKNIEIIVVDDFSTDGTRKYLDYLEPIGPHLIKVYNYENMGIAFSKNAGILRATGDLITFIDADDLLCPDSIERRVEEFEKDPDLEFLHTSAFHLKSNCGYTEAIEKTCRIHGKKHTLNAQSWMIRRDVFKKHGMFYEDRNLHGKEDKLFSWTLGVHPDSPLPKLVKSKKIMEPTVYYRVHPDSVKHSRTIEQKEKLMKAFKKRIKKLKKEGITKENTRFLR